MPELLFEFPLRWPVGKARTASTERQFQSGFSPHLELDEVLAMLEDEISTVQVQSRFCLSSDIEHLEKPHARKRKSGQAALALHISLFQQDYALACDKWFYLEHNLYAIYLSLRNLLAIERYGVASLSELLSGLRGNTPSTAGFSTLRPAANSEDWRSILGLGATASLEDAHAVYRSRVKSAANDQEALLKLNLAMESARKQLA
jgi:hypothetical protein